jgi:hypothetical protein
MKSTINFLYAVIAVLLVTLAIIAVWLAFKNGFVMSAISTIRGYLSLPF